MTNSRLATLLDEFMLVQASVGAIYPSGTLNAQMIPKDGAAVSNELGGRYLCRYLTPVRAVQPLTATSMSTYVTPTPFTPNEAGRWLAVPAPTVLRTHVILIDPGQLSLAQGYPILGPKWVRGGLGIEYVLPAGYPVNAIVPVGLPAGRWPLLVT